MKRLLFLNYPFSLVILLALGSAPRLQAAPGLATGSAVIDTRDYTLEVFSVYGSPEPGVGVHRYAWSAAVSAAVEARVTVDGMDHVCIGWTGTGSAPASGNTGDTGEFMLTEPASSIHWQWAASTTRVAALEAHLPPSFALYQNIPNPFNPETVIGYDLPAPSAVELTIYNLQGQRVRTLVDGAQPAGEHRVVWDGLDEGGRPAASGIYFYRLTAAEYTRTRRLALVR